MTPKRPTGRNRAPTPEDVLKDGSLYRRWFWSQQPWWKRWSNAAFGFAIIVAVVWFLGYSAYKYPWLIVTYIAAPISWQIGYGNGYEKGYRNGHDAAEEHWRYGEKARPQ